MEPAEKTDDIHFLPLLLDQRLRQLTAPRAYEVPNIDRCCCRYQLNSTKLARPARTCAHAYKNNGEIVKISFMNNVRNGNETLRTE